MPVRTLLVAYIAALCPIATQAQVCPVNLDLQSNAD